MNRNNITGYFMAFITILVWSTTYIFKKHLLIELSPLEILFYRFVLAYILLCVAYPKFNFKFNLKIELHFLLVGFFGVALYYSLENLALKYTQASNYGLIVSSIPIFTALIAHFMYKDEKFHKNLIYGFIFSILGIFLIIFNGRYVLDLNPLGDLLAVLGSIVFAIYSNLLKSLDNNMNKIVFIRKIFMYGIITMIPILYFTKTPLNASHLLKMDIIINLLFLAVLASILATFLWHHAIKLIGVNKTSSFIYLVPMITMIFSLIFLRESINFLMIIGGILILFGVSFTDRKTENKNKSLKAYKQ